MRPSLQQVLSAALLPALLVTPALGELTPEDEDLGALLGSLSEDELLSEDGASRSRRQADEGSGDGPDPTSPNEGSPTRPVAGSDQEGSLECDFGRADEATLCDYTNQKGSTLTWRATTGRFGNWLGGPHADAEDSEDGGYALFETSHRPERSSGVNTESALLRSPLRPPTPAGGQCIRFQYNILGLSADRLRLVLHPVGEEEKQGAPADHRQDLVLWSSAESDEGWQQVMLLYSYGGQYKLVFEAIPRIRLPESEYRGHVAVDAVRAVRSAACRGHCTFDGGLCGWRQDDSDDFQWTLSRGSLTPKTGPRTDHGSEVLGGTAGGYAFANSAFPRQPGDRSRLLSPKLPATGADGPLCFRFWTYMFGSGVGTLRVLRLEGDEETELWRLSGSAGKQWYQGQVPVAADRSFTLAIEAQLSATRLGDIAIDDVSLMPGLCSAAPQVAAVETIGCTFEVDDCGWTSSEVDSRLRRRGWERVPAANGALPAADHTLRLPSGHMMSLVYSGPQRPGQTSSVASPPVTGSERAKCLTFWYYMDELVPRSAGARLGSLRASAVYTDEQGKEQTVQLWRLNNAQQPQWLLGQAPVTMTRDYKIVFEGTWGGSTKGTIALDDIILLNGACQQQPAQSAAAASECDFQQGSCGWRNTTSDSETQQRWRPASELLRPLLLADHTFRAPTGYLYFDVYSPQDRRVRLRLQSPPLDLGDGREQRACVRFWFATISHSSAARLRVLYSLVSATEDDAGEGADDEADEREVWSLRASDADAGRMTWLNGEAAVPADSGRFRVTFEGSASDRGFALDDVTVRPGACRVRPPAAAPAQNSPGDNENQDDSGESKQ
ncbi:MAM and LDL-receptor class A domain-containing protein 1-like [Pollicipes pollicipes]|uniref:MAM and LDL-receptor class A domain-containing protein 1-like n=1 Tax=Pollicipes pollicipes TaxID=41117 RepID=UPI001884E6B6|nr:MAM and LDL-receptor class A domain-containing protein 1-like [Pollicipes pollicipes]